MLSVHPVPALKDNYIWLLEKAGCPLVAVVDPGDAAPVEQALKQGGWQVGAILITHHHWDHTQGIEALVRAHGCPVFAPAAEPVRGCTRPLDDGERFRLPGPDLELQALAVPGHTLGALAYCGEGLLFSGDTLFSAGCGRLFEGTPEQMHRSLARLAALPPDTRLYCGHEYTVANLDFALRVEPENTDAAAALETARRRRAENRPTLPSTLAQELRINPFLRCGEAAVRRAAAARAGVPLEQEWEVFAALRRWKDDL